MFKKSLILWLALALCSVSVMGQFSTMTDQQVLNYAEKGLKQGKSQQQLVTELAARGVTREQAERVKALYEEKQAKEQAEAQKAAEAEAAREREAAAKAEEEAAPADTTTTATDSNVDTKNQVFGRNIFNNKKLTFEPSSNLPTPVNYRLGPGDEIIIDVWGSSEVTIQKTISPDGFINIESLGLIQLSGMTIEQATEHLRKKMEQTHAGINGENATSQFKVTLGKSRTIQVNIMGEVQVPGTYSLSAFATVFHALYSAGGVSDIGSLRNIQLTRNGKVIAQFDIYDFILNGKTRNDLRLQEGDIIIVPPYQTLVQMEGNVKRPMKYEMKKDETIATLLKYAGNFASNAYTRSLKVVRLNGREHQVFTVEDIDYSVFKLNDGDVVTAEAVLDRFENKLEIKGAVYRPGIYQFGGQLNTVKQLIEKADGLMGDAFLGRAVLHRQREDLTREIIQVDLKGIMNGVKPDIALQRNDVLYIPSIHDISEIGKIEIFGEVAKPGKYVYADNMTLEDLVIQAGGLLESASTVKVDVSRRIKNNNYQGTEAPSEIGTMYSFSLKDGFVVSGEPGFVLEPYDQVYVRKSPGYKEQVNVSIDGEVLYGGTYSLTNKSERLTDLVKKAGGVTQFAYVKGAKLMRKANEEEIKRVKDIIEMMRRNNPSDSDTLSLEVDSMFSVGIDLEKAIENPGSDADVVLREGDRLIVPELTNTVKINGAVMMPNTVAYQKGKSARYYIGQAGGFANGAKKSKAFVIYMNGQVAKVSGGSKKLIEPGCEIIVPMKDKSKAEKWNFQSIIGMASSLGSLGLTAASVANILK